MNGDSGRGRGLGRGRAQGGRGDGPPPPGMNVRPQGEAGVSQAMGAMSIAGGEPRGIGRGSARGVRRDVNTFDLVATRDASLSSKKGTSGNPVKLLTNYFSFKRRTDYRLMQYRVDLSLEEDRTFVRRAIVHRCKDKLPPYLFDGTMMFTTEPIFPHAQQDEFRITSAREDREAGTQEPCEVIIRKPTELHPTDFQYLQFYNIVLRRTMEKMELKLLGRNYYNPNNVQRLTGYNLEVWPGYITSIRQHEEAVLLCAEVANKVVRTDTALDQMKLARGDYKAAMLGAIVLTKYNEKTYRVDDVDTTRNPTSTFPMRDGTQKSYVDYYREKYQVHIKDLKQPLFVSMPKEKDKRGGKPEPVMLVPELCYMTGITDEMRSNFNLMKAMGEYTRMGPKKRVETLMTFANALTGNPGCKAALKEWGMEMNTNLLEVPGRVLMPEDIFMKDQRVVKYDQVKGEWNNGFRSGLNSAVPIRKWICVYPQRECQRMTDFWKVMQSCLPGLNLEVAEPKWAEVADIRTSTYVQKLRECVALKPNFIMVIVPNEKGDVYATCKKFLCIDSPVPSQFITVSKVLSKDANKQRSMATKVLVQMTTKMGGAPWVVKNPLAKFPIMVVGFDTYHDAADKGFSVGALVASLDQRLSRYFSIAKTHLPKEEISNCVPALMTAALREYTKINGTLPKKIFFYRDGVGDGQLQHVHSIELEAVKSIFADLQPGYNPDFAFIVVSKRINTRFFVPGRELSNPLCGTVVDDVVTLPERYDFYLVPQCAGQGTVNPTSFNVIHDTSGLSPDRMQQFTYKLCHLYYNWPGTIRVPAPCQYAHKMAYLMGKSLHAAPSPHLCDLLFYL